MAFDILLLSISVAAFAAVFSIFLYSRDFELRQPRFETDAEHLRKHGATSFAGLRRWRIGKELGIVLVGFALALFVLLSAERVVDDWAGRPAPSDSSMTALYRLLDERLPRPEVSQRRHEELLRALGRGAAGQTIVVPAPAAASTSLNWVLMTLAALFVVSLAMDALIYWIRRRRKAPANG